MRIRKSGGIESDQTHCYTEKFNVALSLCRVLEITLYFSKGFLKTATKESIVAEALQSLGVTVVCFLEQESNLWFPVPQQRHKLFSRCFLHLSLVNLLLLVSLEERSTCRESDCFLGVGDLEKKFLVDGAIRDEFALFWEAVAEPEIEAFPYF